MGKSTDRTQHQGQAAVSKKVTCFKLKRLSSSVLVESTRGFCEPFTVFLHKDDFNNERFNSRDEVVLELKWTATDIRNQNSFQIATIKPLESVLLKKGYIAVASQFMSQARWSEGEEVILSRLRNRNDIAILESTQLSFCLISSPKGNDEKSSDDYMMNYLSSSRRILLEKALFHSVRGLYVRNGDIIYILFEGGKHEFKVECCNSETNEVLESSVASNLLQNFNSLSLNPKNNCCDYRSELENFYRLYNHEKVKDVEKILETYRGNEEELFNQLRLKYKVDYDYNPTKSGVKLAAVSDPLKSSFMWKISKKTRCSLVHTSSKETKVKNLNEDIRSVFAEIGGYKKEISLIVDAVRTTFLNPEVFDMYRLKAPRGVLLYGPSGTGKTFIAKTVAAALGTEFFTVNGSEILSRYCGEAETSLEEIFRNAARKKPSIILLDELDSLCPKRGEVEENESKLSSILLSLLDGPQSQTGVFVIGCTNRPQILDSALLRIGRFDRQIEIGVPDQATRIEILRKLLRLPNNLEEDEIAKIASYTHGFVAADLKLLVKEATLLSFRRWRKIFLLSGEKNGETIPFETLSYTDIASALNTIKPSGLRDISVEIPRVRWTDIGGQDEVKDTLKEVVEWPLQYPDAFERMGIKPPKGVLLYGPPGCSKTLMAKALATESSMNFIAIKGPELLSKWLGESERTLQAVFRRARSCAPTIVFFDEIDAIASQRFDNHDNGGAERMISQLLVELDGVQPLQKVAVIAATNRPDIIDVALMRPGRFDRLVYVGPPSLSSRVKILEIGLKNVPFSISEREFDLIAEKTERYSGAELIEVCREASMQAAAEVIEGKTAIDEAAVHLRHIEVAIQTISPQITPETIKFYEEFSKKIDRLG